MFRRIKDLVFQRLEGIDGPLGYCHDLRFEAGSWNIRSLIAAIPARSSINLIKLPPLALSDPDLRAYHGSIPVRWTQKRGRLAPPMSEDRDSDRSGLSLIGFQIEAEEESVGHVSDLLIEPSSWTIRYLTISRKQNTGNADILVSPRWIRSVDWSQTRMDLLLSPRLIENSPTFDPRLPVDLDDESALHEHYGLAPYWNEELRPFEDEKTTSEARTHRLTFFDQLGAEQRTQHLSVERSSRLPLHRELE